MGTMGSDTAYLIPQSEPQFTYRQQHHVDSRWEFWQPQCVISARREADPASVLHNLRSKFHSRLAILLAAQVSWRDIRSMNLDSPITTDEAFSTMIDNIRSQAQSIRKRYKHLSLKGKTRK